MNKKLHDLFNLPDDTASDDIAPTVAEGEDTDLLIISQETLSTIEKVDLALPTIRGLESTDREMDEIADLAKGAFNDLLDLSYQVDSRFSAEIAGVAATMLGHSLSAKEAKVNKKLKMLELRLKQAELERKLKAAADKEPEDQTPLGVATQIDRGDLIKAIQAQMANGVKSSKSDK
jgi:hypothetical protein